MELCVYRISELGELVGLLRTTLVYCFSTPSALVSIPRLRAISSVIFIIFDNARNGQTLMKQKNTATFQHQLLAHIALGDALKCFPLFS